LKRYYNLQVGEKIDACKKYKKKSEFLEVKGSGTAY